jgi:hypothetical protein
VLNPSLVKTKKLKRWDTVKVQGQRKVILVGPEYGVFVDHKDFIDWANMVKTDTVEYELGDQPKPKTHVPFQLSTTVLERGIALLWPSQSFTSLVLFRGIPSWRHGEFHLHRSKLMSGDDGINVILIIILINPIIGKCVEI